jgi:hypothetical protein
LLITGTRLTLFRRVSPVQEAQEPAGFWALSFLENTFVRSGHVNTTKHAGGADLTFLP